MTAIVRDMESSESYCDVSDDKISAERTEFVFVVQRQARETAMADEVAASQKTLVDDVKEADAAKPSTTIRFC